jgi:GGDEF domain-containing protein
MKTLEFKNQDSPKGHQLSVIYCDASSVKQIVQWYGGFHAGDRVTLHIDGIKAKLDHNLELVT